MIKPWQGKEMFYLTTHNTFYLRFEHIIKDHSNSERGNPQTPHGLLLPISSQVFYMHHHRQDSTYHGLWYTVVVHWLDREIAQWVPYIHKLMHHTSSPTGIDSSRRVFWGVMEFGKSRRIKPKERISMNEFWLNLDGPSKIKNCGAT